MVKKSLRRGRREQRTTLADFFTILLGSAQHRRSHDFYIGRGLKIK